MSEDTLLAEGSITILKLSSGEEVVAEVLAASAAAVSLKQPLFINYQLRGDPNDPQSGPSMGFSFIPWCMMMRGPKVLSTQHIMVAGIPDDRLVQAYKRATGGIVVPPNDLILPNG